MSISRRERLQHMLDHAAAASRYLGAASVDELERDDATLSAILWRVCIVGEAAAALQREGEALPALPLQAAKVMRNLLLHQYPEIDVGIVVQTVREDFPKLTAQLRQLLAEDQTP